MCGKEEDQANSIQQESTPVASETVGNGTKPNPSSEAVINLDQ